MSQLPNVHVIEWLDLPLVARWERFNSLLKPGYLSFYARARRWLKQSLRAGETFELVHQITPVAIRYPSPAAGMRIPLIIGPLAGSLDDPSGFETELSKVPWYTKLRTLDEWRLRHDPWLRRSYRSADCVLGVAPYVKDVLGAVPPHAVELMSEIGLEQLPSPKTTKANTGTGIRLLFVGRVIRTKGVRDAIRAMAKVKDIEKLHFDVVGDGNDMAACKSEAETLGVSDRVTFHGRVPHDQTGRFYEQSDVFLFPSFREPSGIVVIEAMSHGLAMIVADRGGPGYVVDDATGIRVPVRDPGSFADEIAAAIRRLAGSPELVTAMGKAARKKIDREFLWNAKIEKLEQVYDQVLRQERESASQLA